MVSCIKTTKNRDKCRSLFRYDASAARDKFTKRDDFTRNRKAGVFETYRGAGQEGGPVVVNCIKITTKQRQVSIAFTIRS